MADYTVHVGDCLQSMKQMPDQSVNCCVTSPPYFGLRDYGVDGQMGLEASPAEFVEALVAVLREVRRLLRDDGTLWLNLGDSYARNPAKGQHKPGQSGGKNAYVYDRGNGRASSTFLGDGLKEKDMVGIPWRVAFALQADGWYLRQDIIWNKPNPMPESVTDRCTKSHEYVFLLSKSPRYYFDNVAIKEPAVYGGTNNGVGFGHGTDKSDRGRGRVKASDNFKRDGSKRAVVIPGQNSVTHRPDRKDSQPNGLRNRRSVWNVATRAFKGAHFATFPPALIEPCILAGCPVGGTVLDPFGGSGTTAGVAIANERKSIICEINPEYADLIPARIASILDGYGKAPKQKRKQKDVSVSQGVLFDGINC